MITQLDKELFKTMLPIDWEVWFGESAKNYMSPFNIEIMVSTQFNKNEYPTWYKDSPIKYEIKQTIERFLLLYIYYLNTYKIAK